MKIVLVLLFVSICAVSARTVRYVPVPYNVPVRVIYDDINAHRIIIPSRRHLERNLQQVPKEIVHEKVSEDVPKEKFVPEIIESLEPLKTEPIVEPIKKDALPTEVIQEPLRKGDITPEIIPEPLKKDIAMPEMRPEEVKESKPIEKKEKDELPMPLKEKDEAIMSFSEPKKDLAPAESLKLEPESIKKDKESNIVEVYVKPDGSPLSENDRIMLLNEDKTSSPLPVEAKPLDEFKPLKEDFESNEIIPSSEKRPENENLRVVVQGSEDHIAQVSPLRSEDSVRPEEVPVNDEPVDKQADDATTPRPTGPLGAVQAQISNFISTFTGGNRNASANATGDRPPFPIAQIQSLQQSAASLYNRVTNRTQTNETASSPGPIAQIPQIFQNITQSFVNRLTGNRNATQEGQAPAASGISSFVPQPISDAAQSIYNTVTGNRNSTAASGDAPASPSFLGQLGQNFNEIASNLRPSNIIQRLNSTFNPAAQAAATQQRVSEDVRSDVVLNDAPVDGVLKTSEPLREPLKPLEADKPLKEDLPLKEEKPLMEEKPLEPLKTEPLKEEIREPLKEEIREPLKEDNRELIKEERLHDEKPKEEKLEILEEARPIREDKPIVMALIREAEKPELLEKKPELVEAKPELLEKKPELIEAKPELLEKKPELMEDKLMPLEKKPELSEKKSELDEKKPELLEKKPELMETKPELLEKKPELMEKKPEFGEKRIELPDEAYNTLSEKKPELDEKKPELDEKKPELEDKKPELDVKKPQFVETRPELDEAKPEPEVVKPEPPAQESFTESLTIFQSDALRQIERFREALNEFMNRLKPVDGQDDFPGIGFVQQMMNRILDNMEANVNRTVADYLQEASQNRMTILERIRAEFQEDINNISLQFHKWFSALASTRSNESVIKDEASPYSSFEALIRQFIQRLNRVFGRFDVSYNPNRTDALPLGDDSSASSGSSSSSAAENESGYFAYFQELIYGLYNYNSSQAASESQASSQAGAKNETVVVA